MPETEEPVQQGAEGQVEEWMPPQLAHNSLGFFDGVRFSLRSFSVSYRIRQTPESYFGNEKPEEGIVNGVNFNQTMGKIELHYPLAGSEAGLTEDDIVVEMSCWEVRVLKVMGGDKSSTKNAPKIVALSNELFADIRRKLSGWWIDDNDEFGGRWLTVSLAKLTHKAWGGPWNKGPFNDHRKGSFGWTAYHISTQLMKKLQSDEEILAAVLPGGADMDQEMYLAIPPERLCTGVDCEEDQNTITLIIHFDEEALEVATSRVPFEEIFLADVEATYLQVAMRYDGFGICWGDLAGSCIPELTTWDFATVRRSLPKDSGIKCPAYYNPALRIKLAKCEPGLWGKVFSEQEGPEFDKPRERVSWTDRIKRACVLSPAAPMKGPVKEERAQKLCTNVEVSSDKILHRIYVTMHLDARLEGDAMKYGVDLGTFFSMKVGERIIEVNVFADAEFTVCFGKLGGPCSPDKTSWEIIKVQATQDEPEHLALKFGFTQKPGSYNQWAEGEVFTRISALEALEQQQPEIKQASAAGEVAAIQAA